MTSFEYKNGEDVTGWETKLQNLRLPLDREDISFWFSQLEMHLQNAGVKKQWSKRIKLHQLLPDGVMPEIKDLLRKTETTAGDTPYKNLKERILAYFGPNDEDLYIKASQMTMTGKPSQMAKKLIDLL